MANPIDVKDYWTAGGILLGFQITAFSWRISEESKVAAKGDLVWLPPADYLNLAAMIVTVIGVFVAPAFDLLSSSALRVLFGLSALLFLGHALALAGHYELFTRGKKRTFVWWSRQEKIAMSVVAIVVLAYLIVAVAIQ
jgi:hypothetical protein